MKDAGETIQMSLRVPAAMAAELDRIAKAMDRDRTWVMLHAVRRFIDDEGAALLRESNGLAELDRGEGVDFDLVLAEVEDKIANSRSNSRLKKTA